MICKNCKAFFIRYPCPACGEVEEGKKNNSKNITIENGSTSSSQDQQLVRPSQMSKQSQFQKERLTSTEHIEGKLVRPSQLDPKLLFNKSDKIEDSEEEKLVRPSQLHGGSSVNPKIKGEIQKLNDVKSNPKNDKLKSHYETDEEYKIRVKKTLKEVMGLLEELIE